MFRDRDLPFRLIAATLPPRLGYALSRRATPLVGGERMRGIERVVTAHALEFLGDPVLAAETGRRFAGSIACDDLDGLVARLWPRALRRRTLRVEGADLLPPAGRAVFATFHVGGGFRVYDALLDRGFRPAVLAAPPAPGGNLYQRAIDRARFGYLEDALGDGVLPVGPHAARAALRSPAPHLASGGAVIAVLDVAPEALGLRDALPATLLGHRVELPAGLLRLAASSATPVVPFDARLENGRRVIRFHPPIRSTDPAVLLAGVVGALERSIRERPWDWQGWIDVHRLLGPAVATRPVGDPSTAPAAPGADATSASAAGGFRGGTDGDADAGTAIVVAIHDAAEDVRRCVGSVLDNAPADAAILLVDDASRDVGLRAWLEAIPARDARVRLLRNETNRGFVAAANRGFAEAGGRDVLLLNSDTVVPPGFVERLRAAARATPRTGIVTPFTNHGTIFTIPGLDLPVGVPGTGDVVRCDAMIAGTSPCERPEVPTAHGFCMYVRAAVPRCIGAFDEANFGRGYGEENDFCERARAAGFEVRACDDLFVWHRGGASFGGEAATLVAAHLNRLEELHPGYRERIAAFVARDPLATHRERAAFHASRRRVRRSPAMLFVLHANPFADPRRENMGGTQYHVLDLVRGLALPRTLVAWPDEAGSAVAEIEDGDLPGARLLRFAHARPPGGLAASRFTLRDQAWEHALGGLVDSLDVGAAHLHHLAFWPVGLHRVLAERGIPWLYTVQDYYCVCPSWNLLDLSTAERCGCTAPPDERARCLRTWYDACGLDAPADPEALLRAHREEFAGVLRGAHAVIAGCDATRDVVARAFPDEALRWQVVPYGYDRERTGEARSRGGPLRIALVGAVAAPWKGSEQVLRTMRLTRDLPLEWHVFGDSDAHGFPERARQAAGGGERIRFHGRYERADVVERLRGARIDASLLLSPWDETFCYTLSESWAAGAPAIVSDRGALAERTRATGAGLVARDPEDAAAALRRLADEPVLLAELQRTATGHREPTVAENAERHRAIWGPLLSRLGERGDDPPWGEPDRALLAAFLQARHA